MTVTADSPRDMSMDASRLGVLRWQLFLTWSLAEFHLRELTDDALLWAAAEGYATVRLGVDGRWHADWNEQDPDDVPGVTAG